MGAIANCKAGCETYEVFKSRVNGKKMIQYDYRTKGGQLHSCVVKVEAGDTEAALETARARCHFGE